MWIYIHLASTYIGFTATLTGVCCLERLRSAQAESFHKKLDGTRNSTSDLVGNIFSSDSTLNQGLCF